MHGALRVNLRCAAIRAVHDPMLGYSPHDKEGAHPMTVDQDRFVSVTVHNIGIGNLTIVTK